MVALEIIDLFICTFFIKMMCSFSEVEEYRRLRLARRASVIVIAVTAALALLEGIGWNDLADVFWAVAVIVIAATVFFVISVVLGVLHSKAVKDTFITVVVCAAVVLVQTVICKIYLSATNSYFTLIGTRRYFYCVTSVVVFAYLIYRTAILRARQVEYHKLWFWSASLAAVYIPMAFVRLVFL